MASKRANTARLEVDDREQSDDGASPMAAPELVDRAEEILERYVKPGRWPRPRVAKAFRDAGHLEQVLGLYARAIEDEPDEPAYPWNLASSLDRLGLSDLALAYMRRAIRVAEETGDDEWAGADAYLALADIAVRSRDFDSARVAIEHAKRLEPSAPIERYQRLLRQQQHPAAPRVQNNIDAARKGTAVEHLIAATCILASDFELSASTNLVDDEGVDLVFHRRERSTTLALQIKSRSWSASTLRTRQQFIAQVRRSTFKPRPDLFMLFVAVDTAFADYGPVWLIPSEDFSTILAYPGRDRLRFAASAAPGSSDRWVSYRHERSELPKLLLNELIKLEETQ
jgi:tetratricopeptide (TPR) repeat protein